MEFIVVAGIAGTLGFMICALFASNSYDRGYRDATRKERYRGEW